MARFVVDTHALLWFLTASPRLGSTAKAAMLDPNSALIVPAVALGESLWIVEKLRGAFTSRDVLSAMDADARITIEPLTREVVERAHSLTSISEMHDRQIAATALILSESGDSIILLTRDSSIVGSGVVQTAW